MLASHNDAQKSYLRLSSSYFWPKVNSHILRNSQTCSKCQQRKPSMVKPPPLAPLPIPVQPNIRIHANLVWQMLGMDCKNAYILCITDAITKCVVVVAVPNKESETVTRSIFKNCFANLAYKHKLRWMEENITGSSTMQCTFWSFQQNP